MSAQTTAKTTTNRPPSTSKERGHTVGKTKVRTTIEPGKVLEVDDAELVDLHRQRLLHSFERNESTDAINAGKSPTRWRSGEVEVVDSGIITEGDLGASDETTNTERGAQ